MKTLCILSLLIYFIINSYSQINQEKISLIKKTSIEDKYGRGFKTGSLQFITEIPYYNDSPRLKSATVFPDHFDLRDYGFVTSVKNQGSGETCWTFSVIGAIESNWLMTGLGEYDLSEENMATCHGYFYSKNEGGNFTIATSYLVNFKGPILETEDPYTTDPLLGFCKTTGLNITPTKYISEARFIGGNTKAIKNALMKYGAVAASIRLSKGEYQNYYNAMDYTYYYSEEDENDHAILLVGWDDNKIITGGTASPAGTNTGAWIIKNSWGEDWGESGYAYVSYNDTRIAKYAAYFPGIFDINEVDTIFSYDEVGANEKRGYGIDSAFALIKFTSPNECIINRIGTYITVAGMTVDIEIYKTKSGNNLSDLIGSEYDINFSEAGYYLMDIAALVNGVFYIKLKYSNPYDTDIIPLELYEENCSNPEIESGVCWMSYDGKKWDELGKGIKDREIDLCIKAYSTNRSLPYAFFTADKKEICKGSTVIFTDKSLGNIETYSWNFGSGASLQTANSKGTHSVTYSTSGEKTITLTVSGPDGNNEIVRSGYINVLDEIYVHLPYETLYQIQDVPFEITAYGADTYSWSPSTGLDKTTGKTVVSTLYQDSIVYKVSGTQGNCSDSAQIKIYAYQNPPNDSICDAYEITLKDKRVFNNIGARVEYNEPHPPLTGFLRQDGWGDEYRDASDLKSVLDNTVWFYYFAPATGKSSFTTNNFDGAIALYDAETCEDLLEGNYTLIAANDDYIDEPPYWAAIDLRTDLIPDHKYWIQIDGSGGGEYGNFNLYITEDEVKPVSLDIETIENRKNSIFSLYPNPNNGILNITNHDKYNTVVLIEIFNIHGKKVFDHTLQILSEVNEQLDLTILPNGFYIIRLSAKGFMSNYKILIK